MATIARVDFISDNRLVVKKGKETSIEDLFATQARQVGIRPSVDIRTGADLVVKVSKLEPLQAKAANPVKGSLKGDGTNTLFVLLRSEDRQKRLKALDDIKPEEKLSVDIEAM